MSRTRRRQVCDSCKAPAPVARAVLRSNLAFVIARQTVELDAQLCRRCIRGYFWQFTLTTLVLGWWGALSFFHALRAIPANVYWVVHTRHLPVGPAGPVVVDHYSALGWLYGAIFSAFGGICALIATTSNVASERTEMAPGAALLVPGLALLALSVVRRARRSPERGDRTRA